MSASSNTPEAIEKSPELGRSESYGSPLGPTLAPGVAPTPESSPDRITLPDSGASSTDGGRQSAVGPRYEFLGELARGGMGVVYKARDRQLGRVVALKMLLQGIEATDVEIERFHREAEAVARLDHPGIVPLYDYGQLDGRVFFTMPLAEGTLADRVGQFSDDPRSAVAIVAALARAVAHAHAHDVLHRDLKPSNILLKDTGEPLLSDFGLAKFTDRLSDLTRSGQVPGTPAYMAPEQARGEVEAIGPAADVWSLGVILYELLTGERPFTGRNREATLYNILSTDPPAPSSIRPTVDASLEAIILKCLRRDPAQRYSSVSELAEELDRWRLGARPARRRLAWRAATVLAVIAVVAISVIVANRGRSDDPDPTKRSTDEQEILVGNPGKNLQVKWVIGGGTAVLQSDQNDGSVTIHARKGLALVELLPSSPWPVFHLQVRLRHDDPRAGDVGLYFAHQKVTLLDAPSDTFWHLSFAERGGGGLDMRPGVWTTFLRRASWFSKLVDPGLGKQQQTFHQIDLEVSESGIRYVWDSKAVQSVAMEELLRRTRDRTDYPVLDHKTLTSNGIGLLVYQGSATFQRVVISRAD